MKKILACFLLFVVFTNYTYADNKVKFLVFTDLHHDLIPDGEQRLRKIIQEAETNKVDFILDIGDFAFAIPENQNFRDIVEACQIDTYHVIGNHDADRTDKTTYVNYWSMPHNYYFFDKGIFRFIVLDSNFFEDENGTLTAYDKGNYFAMQDESKRDRFSEEQLVWLKDILDDKSKIHIILSHAPINDQYSKVVLNQDIHSIITQAKDNGTRIAACFAGHIHSDNYHVIDGINYLQVNSASYIWGGEEFYNTERYPAAMYEKYPNLPYMIPYEDALFAIIEIDSSGNVTIKGTRSRYMKPDPDEALINTLPYPCSPKIEDRNISF